MQNISNPMTDVGDAAKSLMNSNNDGVFKQFGNNKLVSGPKEFLNSNTLVAKVVFILLVLIIFIFLMRFAVTLLHTLFAPKKNPIIIPGRFSGTKLQTISVNPNNDEGKPILRSANQDMGLEFTYSTWLYIKDDNFVNYKAGEKKHIFNKGSSAKGSGVAGGKLNEMAPQNAPGLYLDGNVNKLLVVMQTYDDVGEIIEIPDIPLEKWLNIVIRIENRHLDVYVNGTIVVRHEMESVPKQNNGNIHVQENGGFMGEQSSLRYFNRALTSLEIQRLVQKGPNMSSGGVESPFPPYLSMRWFTNM